LADDLGCAGLGCYGQHKFETPNIDRLTAKGIRFTPFYAGSAVCAPSRCTLMTGMHHGHAWVRDNSEVGEWDRFRCQMPLPVEQISIAEVLQQAGYATGAFGKWRLGEIGSTGDPLTQGFDRFVGYNCQRNAHNYCPAYLIDKAEHQVLEGTTVAVRADSMRQCLLRTNGCNSSASTAADRTS
jgi:arylsulfatase A-like enzyme